VDKVAYEKMTQMQGDHWWFTARRAILTKIIKSLELSEQSNLLEIGCGPGGNLAMLQGFGKTYAVEPDDVARSFARNLAPDAIVSAGGIPDPLPDFDVKFDLIVLFDVLEHIENPVEGLMALKALLKPDGYIILSVPAYPWLFGGHDRIHHHFRRYTRSALSDEIAAAGYKIEYLSSFNMFLALPAMAVRLGQRFLKLPSGHDEAYGGNGFMNKLLAFIFGFERHFIPLTTLPFGLSIIVIIKKA
jgi:SAM-dependent methyltransferase